jgi:hypothetical protein
MNRTEALGLFAFSLIAAVSDAYFVISRCSCSPEIHAAGFAAGLLLQVAAVSVVIAVHHILHDSEFKVRVRALGIGLFACVVSLPVMETAILFGDSIGREKGFPSSGYTCNYLRLLPDGVPPNKLLHATCEDART